MSDAIDASTLPPHDTTDIDQKFADIDSFVSALLSPKTPSQVYANDAKMTATPTPILLPRQRQLGMACYKPD